MLPVWRVLKFPMPNGVRELLILAFMDARAFAVWRLVPHCRLSGLEIFAFVDEDWSGLRFCGTSRAKPLSGAPSRLFVASGGFADGHRRCSSDQDRGAGLRTSRATLYATGLYCSIQPAANVLGCRY